MTRVATSDRLGAMPALTRTTVLALLLVSTLAGCGDDSSPESASAPRTAPTVVSSGVPTSPETTTAPSPVPSGTSSAAPDADCGVTGKVVPDGEWQGPITMDVRGGDGSSGYADSKGTGRLSMTVEDGTVTDGTWTIRWASRGEVDNGQVTATVDLTGKVTGTVTGAAAKPALAGTWEIVGTATVTKPVSTSAPFEETGKDAEKMTIRASACDRVTGTFVPSFTSKDAAVTFTGTAEWVGTRR